MGNLYQEYLDGESGPEVLRKAEQHLKKLEKKINKTKKRDKEKIKNYISELDSIEKLVQCLEPDNMLDIIERVEKLEDQCFDLL